jgi:hypothetical protein
MAITTYAGLQAAILTARKIDFYKVSATAEAAPAWHSLRAVAAMPQAGTATPAVLSGVVCNDLTSGSFGSGSTEIAIPWGANNYLLQVVAQSTVTGKLIIYDRLWHSAGLTMTNTVSVQICTTLDLTRPNSQGTAVEMWGEIVTAPGATACTVNVEYQNQDGVSGRTATYAHPANAETAGQMFPFVLNSADTGVQIVQKQYCSVSAGGGGQWGVVLLRRVAEIPIDRLNSQIPIDFATLGLPRIYASASLHMMIQNTATSTGIYQGTIWVGPG